MPNSIHYVFSTGHRSKSWMVLKEYGLCVRRGPFDFMIIDLETCFANIQSKFGIFLDYEHFVMIQQNERRIVSYKHVNDNIIQLVAQNKGNASNQQHIRFMNQDYYDKSLYMNQSYVHNYDTETPLGTEIYRWDRVCIFNQNVFGETYRKSLFKRCESFEQLHQIKPKHITLFHITPIIDMSLEVYKRYIEYIMADYEIQCFLTIIVCTIDPFQNKYERKDNILYIYKMVDVDIEDENEFDFEDEMTIMKEQLDRI